jgi:pimeloyl-ACP methyl ester carboxylesterase
MLRSYLWTASFARMQLFRASEGKNLNWLFLPGGPGVGSESLFPLLDILQLPGNIWRLDLPGDGSNVLPSAGPCMMQHWSKAIIEAVTALDHVIFVGHSTGGMFALATAELKKKLKGLVLLNSAPDKGWQEVFAKKVKRLPLSEAEACEEAFKSHPNDETLKRFVLASAPYCFTKKGLKKGIDSLENLPFNYEAMRWSQENFDPFYEAAWIPDEIPTMILSGSEDEITPLELFAQKKEYDSPNILLKKIDGAGHFPWVENPHAVLKAFQEYILLI